MAAGGAMLVLDAVSSFVTSRRVGGCSRNTLAIYEGNLRRFAEAAPPELRDCAAAVVTEYLAGLQQRLKPASVHQHYRCLRTFFRWCVDVEAIPKNPMSGLRMKVPKALPRVPEPGDVKKLLDACGSTFAGRRNMALVALLIDSGLRISEAVALRVGDMNLADGTISVRNGKGGKDGVGFFGAEASRHVRSWMKVRINLHPDDLLFCTRDGQPLTRQVAGRILYRLSAKAGLGKKIGPHALRHYAATSILRQTGDLELVRRVLRHESLTMTLRYAQLTGLDVSTKFRRASPLSDLTGA